MIRNLAFRHRLIGAIFIVSLAIIIIPAIFDSPSVDTLAVKEALPVEPTHEDWKDLNQIEYSFAELSNLEPNADVSTGINIESGSNMDADLNQEMHPQLPESDLAPITPMNDNYVPKTLPEPENTPSNNMPTPKELSDAKPQEAPKEMQSVVSATEQLITQNAWAVQLGAFSKAENAESLVTRLKDKGYLAYTQAANQLTRVLVGAEKDKQKAQDLLTQLDNDMHLKGIIVQYNAGDNP